MKPSVAWAAALTMACLALAGCSSSSGSAPAATVDPSENSDYVSGREIHLKMSVVDYDQELYPGMHSWLWAFCVEAFDPGDAASVAAIEYFDRLPGDGTNPEVAGQLRDHCGVPGPTIRVHQGDHVVVEFTNTHVHPHTIHWHGQYVPGDQCPESGCADGAQGVTQQAVKGTPFVYDFIAKRAGTLWYHCHVDAGFHMMQGLYGMFIVEPKSTDHEPKNIDHEETMILSTVRRAIVEAVPGTSRHNHPPGCFVSGTPNCQNPPQILTPDIFMINGHSYPFTEDQPQSVMHIESGKDIRVRILNAGNTQEEIHLHGHDMEVIAEDGVALAVPYYVDTLRVGPAERFDVVIHGNNPGVWLMHTHVAQDETNDLQFPGGMHTMLVYKGFEDKMHNFPAELAGGMPYHADVFPPSDHTFSDTVYMPTAAAAPIPGGPAPTNTANVQRTFGVPMECALKTISFTAQLSGSQASQTASSLDVAIRKPGDGPEKAAYRNGALGFNQGNPGTPTPTVHFALAQAQHPDGTFELTQGNWTISITGRAAESIVALTTDTDYYASWDEQLESHHSNKTPLCGTYGYGNEGRVVGAGNV
ncbi:MAG: multicopper oxidase family protein [bacterium]